tara:strand:+ start:48893 stop:50425 length:1533 start_codon:yes stop_codon:yes gene_type:complete
MKIGFYKYLMLVLVLFVNCKKPHNVTNENTKEKALPNILFVLAEDISTDLECYGMHAVKTPILNNLAKTGIQFMNAYGNNSICSPSRSNMITGVHQNITNTQHHRSNRDKPLANPYKPITSYLRDAGYTCIIGNNLVSGGSNKIDVNFKHQAIGNWNGETEFGLFDKQGSFETKDQPFFAQVTLNTSHRGSWWDEIRKISTHKVDPKDVVLPPYIADTPEIRLDWAKYLDQIEYVDYEMGLLIEELEKKGMRDNTLIIFIGDNGRCNIRGKGYLYQSGLHLPLIANWPAELTGGKKDFRLVASIDVAATILGSADIALPNYMTSRNILKTDENPREYIYSARDLWDEVLEQSRAITTHNFKYIKNNITTKPQDRHQAYLEFYRPALHIMRRLKEEGKLTELQKQFFEPAKASEELYDIVNDPFETNNLIHDENYQEQANKMRGYYYDWNTKHTDLGFDKQTIENVSNSEAAAILKWIKKVHPEAIEQMKKGLEPGFTKYAKEYKKVKNNK